MADRDDVTRLTHFEPLSPVTAPAQGSVFKFFGRLFRAETEEASPPTASVNRTETAPASLAAASQGESGGAADSATNSPECSKRAPNGSTGALNLRVITSVKNIF